jgi:hypothetical protein
MRHTEEARRKVSEAHRRRGVVGPGHPLWAPEEDELLRTLPPAEVARRTGRSPKAATSRRMSLGLPPWSARK